jgi:tetratricopeptide (TPR) repeat protein
MFSLAYLCTTNSYASSSSSQERFYKRINTIEKLMGDRNFNEALTRLDKLYASYKNRKYEKSLIFQLYGYVYSQKGDTDKAIKAFNDCLILNTLPESALQNLRLNISQLHLDKKQYVIAEKIYVSWLANGKPLLPEGYSLGGIIYASQKKYDDAEEALQKAVNSSKQPKEDWLKLLLSIYMQSKKYQKAKLLLTKMIARFPTNKDYWMRMADIGYLLKEYELASSVLAVAEKNGLLTTGDEYKKLSGLYYSSGIPYKSATAIELALKKKFLTPSVELLRQQAYYYRQAKAHMNAIQSLQRAITLSPMPVLYYEIAQNYVAQNMWEKANKILLKMSTPNNHQFKTKAALLLGQTYFEQKKYTLALDIFNQLASVDEASQEVKQWKLYTQQIAELSD